MLKFIIITINIIEKRWIIYFIRLELILVIDKLPELNLSLRIFTKRIIIRLQSLVWKCIKFYWLRKNYYCIKERNYY